jgi:DNA-binding NarL/FixJ family response regulator
MIRVAIADDHAEMLVALRLLLSFSEDVEVVCAAGSGQEAVECVTQLQPDILVMDIQMPELDGLQATRQIVNLGLPTRVILISIYRGGYFVRKAQESGAKGFLPKDDVATSLTQAVRAVQRGEEIFVE